MRIKETFLRAVTTLALLSFVGALLPAASPVMAAGTINFAGRTWAIRSGGGGPGPNTWDGSSDSVFVDSQGQLHLKIRHTSSGWTSSEVYLPNSLGYGTYMFEVASRVDLTDHNEVASPFLYRDDSHEIDIEFADWQSPGAPKGNFTVQPGSVPGSHSEYPITLQNGVSVHSFTWTPQSIVFSSAQNGKTYGAWTYVGKNNFAPGGEKLHLNHWLINGLAPTDGQEKDFVIKSFTFTPWKTGGTATPAPAPVPKPAPVPAPKPQPVQAVTKSSVSKSKLKKRKQRHYRKRYVRRTWRNRWA